METTIKTLEAELTMTELELWMAKEAHASKLADAIDGITEWATEDEQASWERIGRMQDRVSRIAAQISHRTPSGYMRNYR